MSIILSLIAKFPDVVLSEYSDFTGNFHQITRVILQKLKPDCKYLFEYGKYKYYYINENKITYLCLCDGIPDYTAFAFLGDVKKKVLQEYEIEKILSFKANQLKGFADELKNLMVLLIQNSINNL
jgi:hypothetical protein